MKSTYLFVPRVCSTVASLFVCIIFVFNSLITAAAVAAEIVSVKKIWDAGRHNAFTDLIRFENRWYCSFREADDHVGGDGQSRVPTSLDGDKWESAALLGEPGIDLRDSKLSITADGRLMHEGKTSVYLAKVRLKEEAKAPAAIPPTKPNIVFIMADDLGWADVAFHGGNSATPNLDKLAREGLELAQHYVAPVCSPTRTGLMTGRCWSRFGVTSPQNNVALQRTTVTLPLALKSVGYETCLTGKWHLGSLPSVGPNHFGFDHSYGSLAGGVSPWNHRYKQGEFEKTWHRNETLIDESGHVTDLIAAEAISWIEERGAAPFFLYVPFTAVHLPVKEPKEWLQRVPAIITDDVARHYAASVMHLDDAVGRIAAALEKKGVRKNTMLVFTSDNGGNTAENNDLKYPDDQCPSGKLPGNNKPWRGQKGELYEGGTRVPTIVSWPGRVKAGSVNSPVQITDWMPTFCSLAGYKTDRNLKWDGTNIASLLVDHKPLPDRSLYAVAPNWRSRSLRQGQWKLIVFEEEQTRRKIELFDMNDDAKETSNVAEQFPKHVERLLIELENAAARDRDAVAEK